MKYQLVLQFRSTNAGEFDALVGLEESLTIALSPSSYVDGHDFGSDEFNIFIFTDDPKAAFSAAEAVIQHQHPKQPLKAAYRDVSEEDFVILWPPTLTSFTVM